MRLDAYLDRIGFIGDARPDAVTLRRVHRAHVEAIPYENLDVQFKHPLTLSIAGAYDKIVGRRRGGWCYEMNGLLGWALEEIGFDVTRLAGAVHRETLGDAVIGNHLVLLVRIDGAPWLADAGYGDGLIEPTPLREGPFCVGPFACALERAADGWWRYRNDPRGGAPSFDFHEDMRDENLLEERCRFLQSDPNSVFVQSAVLQRWRNDRHYCLRGRVIAVIDDAEKQARLLADADEYVVLLKEFFGLDLPEAKSLWPAILARHDALFGAPPQG